MSKTSLAILGATLAVSASAFAVTPRPSEAAKTTVDRIAAGSQFKQAGATLDAQYDRFVEELIQLAVERRVGLR